MRLSRIVGLLVVFASFACFFPGLVAQEKNATPDTAQISEAETREKAVVDRFWGLLERAPRRGTSLDRVYGYYVDTGQMDQLVEKCVKLTEEKPDDAKVWLLLGLVLSRRNDDEGTIKAFEKAEQLDAQDALASFYLGESLIAQGRLREAAAALERSVERKPQRSDVLAVMQTLGRVYERFADKDKAAKLWSRMEELFPNDSDILVRIAETLEEEGKYDDALARYQKLGELAGKSKDHYGRVRFTLSAADIKIRLGNKQEAVDDFDALLEELAGDNWLADSVRDRVERVFVRQADYAGLAGYYQKRLQSHPNDIETTRRLAVALVRLGRTDEAKQLLEGMLEKAPSNIMLRLGLIDLLVNDREFDRVDEEYAKINELDPNNPDHIAQWGLAALENRKLGEQQRKSNATKVWRKLVEARPNDQATMVMVADLMAGGKINDEAEKLYRRAVELSPNDPSYREYLGFFYHRTEQKDKAVETLKQIAEGDRRTAGNLAQLANIYKSLGYADESLEAMRAAAELAPRDFEMQLALADMLMQNADFEAAKTQLPVAEALVESDDERLAYSRVEVELLTVTDELKPTIEKLAEELRDASPNAKRLWQLAVYRRADGAMVDATESIEKALAIEPASLMLLETAADIHTKAFDERRAADIFEKLATVDAARRVDHLKKLANLQRDMGQTDKAIETARLVMATGSGNVANSRFYADMLIGIGRRTDGIEALRRAVRIDPTDQVSLSALAEQLAQDGQLDEAIEINWRIFDRTEDLQGKIGQVGKLSNYYQQGNRFDQLIARLRQNTGEPGKRREAAYCLAQAHASVGDYFAARNALEMLLTNVDEEKSSDTFLLDQLSRVAEMQGDFASAIRYQEMLCDQTSLAQDRDRLLGLYYAAGERDKAATVYLQMVAANVEFADQISVLDKLLAREDYAVALTLVERLEMKYPNNWELMYRKMQAMYWGGAREKGVGARDEGLGDSGETSETTAGMERSVMTVLPDETYAQLAALARAIRKLELPDDELSAVEQKAKNAAQNKGGIQAQGGTAVAGRRISMGSNYSPWGFGEHHGYINQYFNPGGGQALAEWTARNTELVQTLFRERLRLEQYYYNRGGMTSSASPEKPLFKPVTFADAKFAALAWEMKFAHDRDVADFLRDFPEEAKLLRELPEETSNDGRGVRPIPVYSAGMAVGVGQVMAERTDTPEDDAAKEEAAKNRERVEKALKFERLLALVESTEKELPADSDDTAALLERLRFEMFRGQLVTTVAVDDEIILPLDWLKNMSRGDINNIMHGGAPSDSAMGAITVQLGMKGEKDWKNAAFRVVMQRVTQSIQMKTMESINLDAQIAKVTEDIQDETERAEMAQKIKEKYESETASQQKAAAETQARPDGFDDDGKRLDWLVEALLETAAEDPRQLTTLMNHYSNVIGSLPQVYRMLENFDRKDDLAKLDAMIDRLAEQEPQFYMLRMQLMQMTPETPRVVETGLIVELWRYRRQLENGDKQPDAHAPLPPHVVALINATRNAENDPEEWKTWVGKMKEGALKDIAKHSQTQVNQMTGAYTQSIFELIQHAFTMQLSRDHELINIFGSEAWNNASNQNMYGISYSSMGGGVYPSLVRHNVMDAESPADDAEKEKKKLTPDEVKIIAGKKGNFFELADFYLEIMGELKAAQAAAEKQPVRAARTPARQRGQSLSQYRYYFQGHNNIGGYEVRNLINNPSSSPMMGGMVYVRQNQPDNFFMQVYRNCMMLDALLENCEPGEGVTAEQIAADNVERFKNYLAEKAGAEDAAVAEIAKNFNELLQNVEEQQLAAQADESDLDKLLAELEAEYAETKEKNVDLPGNKLLALSLIYSTQKKFAKVMECLDAMNFTSASDVKMRETIALQLYNQGGDDQEKIKARAEQAVDRLLGYQLASDELRTLRGALMQFDRKAEADAIRDRLLVSAADANTMGEMLQELRNAGDEAKEQTVQYALKVFRSPAFSTGRVLQPNSWEKHIRDQAVDILQQAGKLGEIVEQIEAQWKSSPGSFDIMVSLAEIYTKANRKDDAAKIIDQMKSQIPDDAQKMINFANLLRNFDRKDEAAEWMNKALAKKPELFLQNYWEYQRFYSEIGQMKQLLDFVKNIDRKVLLQQSHQLTYCMRELMRNDATKEDARKFFDELWEGKDMSANERQQIRRSLLNDMIWNPEVEFYSYFASVVLEGITPTEPDQARPSRASRQAVIYNQQPMHATYSWSSDEGRSLSGSFVGLAQQANKLDELQEQVGEITAKHLETEEAKRDWNRYTEARILEALIFFQKDKTDEGLKIIGELRENKKTSELFKQSQSEMTLGQVLEKSNDPRAVALAIELFEGMLKSRNNMGSYVTQLTEPKLVLLYIKTGNKEKGIDRAVSLLRQNLRYMKLCGNNSYVQIGNNHYDMHSLSQSVQRTATALKDAGAGLELLRVYREMCEGQTWYTSLLNDRNRRYYTDQFKDVFSSLLDNTSVDDIVANIEIFLPLPKPVGETVTVTPGDTEEQPKDEAEAKTAATVTVPLFLGVYRKPVEADGATIYSCKFFDALQRIAEIDADKFAVVRESLAKLREEHPDDATVLATETWCRMIAGETADDVLQQLQACADWAAKQESTENVSDQLLLVMWLLARQVYTHADVYPHDRFGEPCKTLSVFSCAYISRKVENIRASASEKEGTAWLSDEFKRFAPAELQDRLKATVSVEGLKASLLPNGQLTSELGDSFYDIEAQYLAAVKAGGIGEVMGVFETLFKNIWPGLGNNPHVDYFSIEAGRIFVIFNTAVDAVLQSDDESTRRTLFDSLARIVLAPESNRQVFFAMNESLGGRNGYYRSPMIVLVELALRDNRLPELQSIIDDKRRRLADRSEQQLLLDAVELAIALKTNDAGQIEKHVATFLKRVRDDKNADVGRTAIVAIADQGIRPETLDLLDASFVLAQQRPPRYAHFAYYLLRENMMPLIRSGKIEMAVRWAERYRDICREANLLEEYDGTRTSVDDHLLMEWEKCLNEDRLEPAVAILKYFAAEPADSHRYRDLGRGLDLTAEKLAALDDDARAKLLNGLNLESVARESSMPKDPEAGKPKIAENFDLPELAAGTLVYENDFEESVGENWSTVKREITSRGGRRGFLGEFYTEPVTFRKDDLPEHKFLRIRFDLFMLDGLDGLVGAPRHFGVDSWQMKIDNDLVPIGSSFSNFHNDPNNQKQSYPDDYPPLFGRKPSWYHRVENDSLWDDNLETGFYYGRHGAAEENAISPRKSAIYAIDMIVPHEGEGIEILFQADFKDGPFERALYHLSFGECWGLDNFRVETLEEPLALTDAELAICFDALVGDDGVKANAARWRLVAAGDRAVDYVAQWFAAEDNASKAETFRAPGNFPGFRVWRVLQLIDTENAAKLMAELFDGK